MTCHWTYRYRLKASEREAAALRRFAGCCRFVWNELLAHNELRRKTGQKVQSYAEMCKHLTALKSQHVFLRGAYSCSLQQTLRDLSRAYTRAFSSKTAGIPRFKKRGKTASIRFPAGFRINGSGVYLPKVGWIGFRKSRDIEGAVKSVVISFDALHWYISVQVEREQEAPMHPSSSAVGIDVGIVNFATLSDGSYVDSTSALKRHIDKLRRMQRRLDRKQTSSKNWQKARKKVARLHRKISNTRIDAIHKASTIISKNHAVAVLEDLNITNMTSSARGSSRCPGRNVRAKSGLNRRILDQGWGRFRFGLTYKLRWRGGAALSVPFRDTSRTCAQCGFISSANRKTQARFECTACGHKADADINAAINILRRAGQVRIACGDMRLRVSMKQEAQLVAEARVEKAS